MELTPQSAAAPRRIGYQNVMLTAIALILAVGALEGGVLTQPPAAQAQPQNDGGLTSALEQRKQMIAELRTLNSKMDRIEAKLNSGLSVKVTEMPPVKLQDQKGKPDAGEAPGRPGVEVRPAPSGK
jgi:hypothetical protein